MVIGQILGLPIAFGSGQLSGAGFGPNYTILMKLGYEFYAPRVLDEMQKNPEKSFENTKYWRAFQTHLKSYTDKVLTQTIDSLADFPVATLEALFEKFGKYVSGGDTYDAGFKNPLPLFKEKGTGTIKGISGSQYMSFLTPILSFLPQDTIDELEKATQQFEQQNKQDYPSPELIPEQLSPQAKTDRAKRIADAKRKASASKLIKHPAYFRQMKSLQNNRNTIQKRINDLLAGVAINNKKLIKAIKDQSEGGRGTRSTLIPQLQNWAARQAKTISAYRKQIAIIQNTMNEFAATYKP